jgi:hypothetical protein
MHHILGKKGNCDMMFEEIRSLHDEMGDIWRRIG